MLFNTSVPEGDGGMVIIFLGGVSHTAPFSAVAVVRLVFFLFFFFLFFFRLPTGRTLQPRPLSSSGLRAVQSGCSVAVHKAGAQRTYDRPFFGGGWGLGPRVS